MSEKPIIFSAPMVRAILEGRKTQTRRVVKPQPVDSGIGFMGRDAIHIGYGDQDETDPKACLFAWQTNSWQARCPYGKPGDTLWVREGFCHVAAVVDSTRPVIYKADGGEQFKSLNKIWRSSIHMPRWASRITLQVTDIRVERLQDITYEDALAEGAADYVTFLDRLDKSSGLPEFQNLVHGETAEQCARRLRWPQRAFANLWNSLNAKRGYGWDTNQWIFVIEFKRMEN